MRKAHWHSKRQTFPELSMEIALMMKFFTGYFGKLYKRIQQMALSGM